MSVASKCMATLERQSWPGTLDGVVRLRTYCLFRTARTGSPDRLLRLGQGTRVRYTERPVGLNAVRRTEAILSRRKRQGSGTDIRSRYAAPCPLISQLTRASVSPRPADRHAWFSPPPESPSFPVPQSTRWSWRLRLWPHDVSPPTASP